jgi:hypothetical protein
MKLYIPNLDLSKIITNNISKYAIHNDKIIEIYSDEGIFICKNNQGLKKMSIIDGNFKYLKKYTNDFDLIIDESYFFKSKYNVSRLPNKHEIKKINKIEYKLNVKSPVTLVIETNFNEKVTNIYFMLTEKHGKYSIADVNNPFTKETINSFLQKIYLLNE